MYASDRRHLFQWEHGRFKRQAARGAEEFVSMLVDRQHRLWMASGGPAGITLYADGKLQSLDVHGGAGVQRCARAV